jgi:glycosyltransferase involved in cell wall biosynthesis
MENSMNQQSSQSVNVSVIVSLYNYAESANELYQSMNEVLSSLKKTYEIVIIDDGSTDSTYQQLQNITSKDSRIRVIKMRSSFGEASNLEAGLNYSSGETVVYLSGRVRINFRQIPDMLNAIETGDDLVVGWRFPRRDGFLNRFTSGLFNWIVGRITKIRLHDINSSIIVTRRSVLENISYYGDLYNFIPIIARWQGYRVTEIKIEQLSGSFRKSKYPQKYIQRILDIITVIFLMRYSKKPIHFLGFLGPIFVIAGLGSESYLFVYRILQMGPIAGRPLLILGALLLVIGIQMISIGLLGEMIIFTHAGDIKDYNIEKILNP